jgi:biotin synthase
MQPCVSSDRSEIVGLLSEKSGSAIEAIRRRAEETLLREIGPTVHYRGLIEFSNVCAGNCHYCGIRGGNRDVRRYTLTEDQIVDGALWSAAQGYGSVVLQSGERTDERFVSFVERVTRRIRESTVSEKLPQGVGITLCVGEQSEQTYRRFFDAGAHRYLLRIETSSPELFARIHPTTQRLGTRVECLHALKRVGFRVGTGVMIGLPGQTVTDLAADIEFFRDMDVDMIGMGPYVPHAGTPMHAWPDCDQWSVKERMRLALLMIAATRLTLRDVNIAATTALQALDPQGREQGLRFGANIIMPQLTPTDVRKDYLLYEGKPCLDESAEQCRGCLERRILSIGRRIGYDEWGDSRHVSRCGTDC